MIANSTKYHSEKTLLQEYRPRFGYKRANDEIKDAIIEVPDAAGTFFSDPVHSTTVSLGYV